MQTKQLGVRYAPETYFVGSVFASYYFGSTKLDWAEVQIKHFH